MCLYAGILLNVMSPVHHLTAVVPDEVFTAETTLHALAEERCTSIYGTPTHYIDLLAHPRLSEFDLSHMYSGVCAAASCPIVLMQQVVQKLHIPKLLVLLLIICIAIMLLLLNGV